jgi:hypothetical protein
VRTRELLAALVVLVGGSLWLFVPDMRKSPASLRDDSTIGRWRLPPGSRALAAWVLVENRGPRTITLTGASIGSELPEGTELLGVRARIGEVATFEHDFPGRPGPFLRLEGFRVPAGRGATVGFGLALDRPGLVRLEDARVRYREAGEEHELRARHTARICVAPKRREC